MNKKTKPEQFFILIMLAVVCFATVCLAGCSGSCFGCRAVFQTEEDGWIGGVGTTADSCCGSNESIFTSASCIPVEQEDSSTTNNTLLLSCDTTQSSCGGANRCYNGAYFNGCNGCGSCFSCGIFWGNYENKEINESQIRCNNGCVSCEETKGLWCIILSSLQLASYS